MSYKSLKLFTFLGGYLYFVEICAFHATLIQSLAQEEICSLGDFSSSDSWRMFCNILDGFQSMYVCTDLLCIVCIGLLSAV